RRADPQPQRRDGGRDQRQPADGARDSGAGARAFHAPASRGGVFPAGAALRRRNNLGDYRARLSDQRALTLLHPFGSLSPVNNIEGAFPLGRSTNESYEDR